MGVRTASKKDVEAKDDSISAAALGDSLNQAEASSLNLEEAARKALMCSCLDSIRDGPCGGEFSNAFLCFVKSQQPEKGSDCVEPFVKMQHCMSDNSKQFEVEKSQQHSAIRALAKEEPTDDVESECEEEDDGDTQGLVPPLPNVPKNYIRLPEWYLREMAAIKASR